MRLAVAALILALAGCSGTDVIDPGPELVTARMLALELGCTGTDDESDTPDKVSCEFQDSFLGITTFDSKSALESDLDTTKIIGVKVLVNEKYLWMIDAPDAATLKAAQEIVGGKLK